MKLGALLKSSLKSSAKQSTAKIKVVLAGNPNAGKTTLFNALTKSSLRTGNFHGVTTSPARKTFSFMLPPFLFFALYIRRAALSDFSFTAYYQRLNDD